MAVLFLIVPDGFRDEEYSVPKQILEEAGFSVITASTVSGSLTGKKNLTTAQVDITLDKISAADYQGIMIVGGQRTYWYNATVLRLLREFQAGGKLVAAICISGCIPAQAGILSGQECTVFPDAEAIADIQKNGGVYVNKPVVVSGNVITADGPAAAAEFGRAMVKFLQQ
ncbi:glutamine amidotransferase 1 super family [Candidatus Termititenax dinenymphae]|uniref:Glutamine amidotransferase 1 super family n=1 Tax=Candidatus Termititenax dinenymphae TaxID=2218523 RepID=A0A388TK73_9BACT|nr:glutamine amidotransferase 1 super family [Candidatus Termititenax dinenymphae]